MLKLVIVAAIFVFAGMVVNYSAHGKLFPGHVPDPPAATSPAPAAEPSAVKVLIDGQVWTCRIRQGRSEGCTLTQAPSARLHP